MPKHWHYFFLSAILFILISGCATTTMQVPPGLPTYSLQGVTYLPLAELCQRREIMLQYDSLTRTAVLSREGHNVHLMAGDSLILVDGKPHYMKDRVQLYTGKVVVPLSFKAQVVDVLFKEPGPVAVSGTPFGALRRVVIDAGHGGVDPGALGKSGLREKDVTLDTAKRLANLLRSQGVEVVMTRLNDRFVALPERVNRANSAKADLFVSIHANANRVRSLRGFEVYYVSPTVSDSKRAVEAAREGKPRIAAASYAGYSPALTTILWDMVYTSNRAESIELSRAICRLVDCTANTKILGVKDARFFVLKGAQMPAVLVEIGFVSNHDEELMLKNGYYRQVIAEGIAQGIRDYAQGLAYK